MKILLASDSHRDLKFFSVVIEYEKPDMVLFTGDHSQDALDMAYAYDIPFYIVKGNCDYFDNKTKDVLELEIENIGKVLLTHGHLYGVKSNLNDLYKFGYEKGANLVLFGHTHIQHRSEFKDILFINPGAITNHEYAIYENGIIEFKGEKR